MSRVRKQVTMVVVLALICHGLTGYAAACMVPLIVVGWAMYFSHFLPNQRDRINVLAFLRFTSVLAIECGWSYLVGVIVVSVINWLSVSPVIPIESAFYACYTLPIALALKRPGPAMDATCRFLVGVFYDTPLHLIVFAYAKVGWRLNSLATPIMDGSILLGSLPYADDVASLRARGVTGVVNMCREWRGPLAAYEALGMEQLHLPFADGDMPTTEAAQEAIAFIERHVQAGGRVLVHCRCGVGRSSTIVASYICHRFELSAVEAVKHLRLARPEVSAGVAAYTTVRLFGAGSAKHARGGGWAARVDGADEVALKRVRALASGKSVPPAPRKHYLGNLASVSAAVKVRSSTTGAARAESPEPRSTTRSSSTRRRRH